MYITFAEYYRLVYISFIFTGTGFLFCFLNIAVIVLKMYQKGNLEKLAIIICCLFILFVTLINILKIVYLENWYPNSIQANNINASCSLISFAFFSVFGAFLLIKIKEFSSLKTTYAEKQNKKYFRLILSLCTLDISALFSAALWFMAESSVSKTDISVSFTIIAFGAVGSLFASLSAAFMFVPSMKKDQSFNKLKEPLLIN
jgi:hypothetical protein